VSLPIQELALFAHIVAASFFLAGYIGTNVCTELARRTTSDEERDQALAFSERFDLLLFRPGGTAVIFTGLAAVLVFGYALTATWVVLSSLLFLVVPALGGLYWAPMARRLEQAKAEGGGPAVRRMLNERRYVVVSRLENLLVLLIVALMVFRPG
jgi:uncharacterized membrane protein